MLYEPYLKPIWRTSGACKYSFECGSKYPDIPVDSGVLSFMQVNIANTANTASSHSNAWHKHCQCIMVLNDADNVIGSFFLLEILWGWAGHSGVGHSRDTLTPEHSWGSRLLWVGHSGVGHSRDTLGLGRDTLGLGTPGMSRDERGVDPARRRVDVRIYQPHTQGRGGGGGKT